MLVRFTKFVKPKSRFLGKMFKAYPLSLVGFAIVMLFAAMALLAPVIAPPVEDDPYICPYDGPTRQEWFSGIGVLPTLPSPEHPFGTIDGYDVYYGCVWGIRTAFRISIVTTVVTLALGFVIGSAAGYFEGIVDELLMRLTDAFFALPGLLYVIIIALVIPLNWEVNFGSFNFTIAISGFDRIMLALGVIGWPPYARLIRGEIKKVKEQDFVEAARAIGCSRLRILTKHILPNSINPVLSLAFLNIGGVVLAASTVAFLGFGAGAGYAEWGTIMANARSLLVIVSADSTRYAFMLFIPGAFLSAFVFGWSLLGDSLKNIMDPTLSRGLNI